MSINTTRTSYRNGMVMDNNDSMVKAKQDERSSWYQSVQHLYMQFLLVTTLYVMEPWERVLMLCIFLSVTFLITYSALVYIPFHIHNILHSTIPSLSAVLMP